MLRRSKAISKKRDRPAPARRRHQVAGRGRGLDYSSFSFSKVSLIRSFAVPFSTSPRANSFLDFLMFSAIASLLCSINVLLVTSCSTLSFAEGSSRIAAAISATDICVIVLSPPCRRSTCSYAQTSDSRTTAGGRMETKRSLE